VHVTSPSSDFPALGYHNIGRARHDPMRSFPARSPSNCVSRVSHLTPLVNSRKDIHSNVPRRSLTWTHDDLMPCIRSGSGPQNHDWSSCAWPPRGRINSQVSSMPGNRKGIENDSSPPVQPEEIPRTPQTPQAPQTPQTPGSRLRRFKHNRNLQVKTILTDEDALQVPCKNSSCRGSSGSPSTSSWRTPSSTTRSNSPVHRTIFEHNFSATSAMVAKSRGRKLSAQRNIDSKQYKDGVTSRVSSAQQVLSASSMAARPHQSSPSTCSSIDDWLFEGDPVVPRLSSADLDREFAEAIQGITADQGPRPSSREQWEESSQVEKEANEEDVKTPNDYLSQPSVLLVPKNEAGRAWSIVRSIGRISARLAQIRKKTYQGDLASDLLAEHHQIQHAVASPPTTPTSSPSDVEDADSDSQSEQDSHPMSMQ